MTSRLEGLANRLMAEELGYLELADRVAQLTDELMVAIEDCDTRRQVELRLDRACCELRLRDAWGPWSREGSQWDTRMREDVRIAQEAADRLAQRVGAHDLPDRLFSQHSRPRLVAS